MGIDRVFRCWRYLVLALMPLSAIAGTCAEDRLASFAATGQDHVARNNANFYACGGGRLCGNANPGWSIEDGESGAQRLKLWYYGPSSTGSVKVVSYGAWVTCAVDNTQDKKCQAMKGTEAAFTAGGKKYPSQMEFCVGGTVAGCGASFTKALGKEADGAMQYTWIGSYTGAKCGALDNDVKPSECKGTWGQVNGVNVCLSVGTDPAATTSSKSVETGTKTTTGSGSGSGTGTGSGGTGTGSGDGTTTTTKETTCDGEKCSTTTTKTTTGTDGTSQTETSTEDEPKTTFCEDNPDSQLCVKSVVGGSCAQMTCEGDAIQCAIAKDQIKRSCEAFDKDTDSGSITNKALSGADKLNTEEMKAAAKTGAVQVGSFDTQGRSWSRSCPADPVIAIPWAKGGQQWSIPFSRLCSPLQLLANAAIAITLLGSLAWVVGGSKAAA